MLFSNMFAKKQPPSPYFTLQQGPGNITTNIKGKNRKKQSCFENSGQSKAHLALGRGWVRGGKTTNFQQLYCKGSLDAIQRKPRWCSNTFFGQGWVGWRCHRLSERCHCFSGGWVGGATAYLGGATAYLVIGATAYLGGGTAFLVGGKGKMNSRIRLRGDLIIKKRENFGHFSKQG